MRPQETWVERQIREAAERGEFDDLPGAGRPLREVDTSDPDWWIRRKMADEGLDAGDALPPALQLRREAAGYPASLVGIRVEDDVREILRDYNARVLRERRRPVAGPASPVLAPTVDVEEMVVGWRALREKVAAHESVSGPAGAADPGPTAASRRSWWSRWRARRSSR
ncbi:hypothetical protein GCM10027055_17330 [Janibacter alkaliphilus]|uniref:DnaJ homologue subfamily C member 28 conserved domain-containing protein n=1 Tax=Janibacter alkaliphilus TaxID=1069963 RepID=A0A852WZY3_9MICO|nr:hypothetical protein [Janibacter alkaliphilus]